MFPQHRSRAKYQPSSGPINSTERGRSSENRAEEALQLLEQQGVIEGYNRATLLEDRNEETDFWLRLSDGEKLRIQVKSSAARYKHREAHSSRDDIYYLVVAFHSVEEVAEKILQYILFPYATAKLTKLFESLQNEGHIRSFSAFTDIRLTFMASGFRFVSNGKTFTLAISRHDFSSTSDTLMVPIEYIANAEVSEILGLLQNEFFSQTQLR